MTHNKRIILSASCKLTVLTNYIVTLIIHTVVPIQTIETTLKGIFVFTACKTTSKTTAVAQLIIDL